jgi:anti-sigma regulatory factor (Ser/Thr protein kinase)
MSAGDDDTDVCGLRHHALLYDEDDEYVERSVAFLRAGLEAGEAAIVAGMRGRLALMREGLGADATRVTFTDVDGLYLRPARTIAAYYGTLLEHLRYAPSVRWVAEVQFGPTQSDWDTWTAYEAITNRAYAHLPAWIVCTYATSELPDQVLEIAWRTHAEVLTGDWQPSPHYEDPRAVLRSLTPQPRPLHHLRTVAAGSDQQSLRETLAAELSAEGIEPNKALDLLVAANEIAANAWEHAEGIAKLRVGRADGRFVCEITDRGTGFDDPLAGYIPPRPEQQTGQGLWIARQLVSRLEFLSTADGHTTRLWL